MKYLQILNLSLLALGITLAVVLAVESLIYAVYLGADPVIGRQLPQVLRFTLIFCIFSVASLLAWLGHRSHRPWRWPAQLLPFAAMIAVLLALRQLQSP